MTAVNGDALEGLGRAVKQWAASAEQTSRSARVVTARLLADADAEVQARTKRMLRAREALAAADEPQRRHLSREVHEAEEQLRRAELARGSLKDADGNMRRLSKRIDRVAGESVLKASGELQRKGLALAEYGRNVSATAQTSPGHAQLRLAGMIGLAVADQVVDAFAQTSDLATASLPDRIGEPLSTAGAAYHEIRANWEVIRLSPEFLAMHLRRDK